MLPMNHPPKKRSGMSGQLSLFALLIFQVLFVLFAMSLNVALVVHDKINLQNSADLAAYYGAMKQAQMLNAMAHINYQIRQSWKLLAWRTKVLGAMANPTPLPLEKDELYTPHNLKENSSSSPRQEGAFVSCISHKWWHHPGIDQIVNDRLCQDMNDDRIDPTPVSPAQTSYGPIPMPSFGETMQDTRRRIQSILHRCINYGDKTWYFNALAFLHWMRDQSHRKLMIYHLARHLQEGGDLEGGKINTGAQTTFEKNLSFMNRRHFQQDPSSQSFELFNSLERAEPKQWIEDQPFFTDLLYAFASGNNNAVCTKTVELLSQSNTLSSVDAEMKEAVQKAFVALSQFEQGLCEDSGEDRFCPGSAGLIKKKQFMVYFGVKARLDYRAQIFLPTGSNITLKAEAYAKPFGGRMGPLNPPGYHQVEAKFDRLLPVQSSNSIDLPDQTRDKLIEYDRLFTPNYSRYPGDPVGLRSHIVQHRWMFFLRKQGKLTKNLTFLLNLETNDPLAFDSNQPDQTPPLRYWEMAAVAPDLFDTTYFTILPSYSEDYFNKVKKILEGRGKGHLVRGDFGFSQGRAISSENPPPSLIDYQITRAWEHYQNLPHPLKKPFYKLKKLEHLLTGFNPPKKKYQSSAQSYGEARDSHTSFGTCQVWDRDVAQDRPEKRIANACVSGGRAGYSVKMVSRHFIKDARIEHEPFTSPYPPWW